jgi:hypothetical protein
MLYLAEYYGIIAAKEVAYAEEKPILYCTIRRREERIKQTRKQIYVTVFYRSKS